jgi:diketogulonate reductase-like aldo/keto reductase
MMILTSLLGEGKLLDKNKFPEIDEMAKNLQITQAQLLLAWALQKGWMVIPKASSVARLKENLKSVHIELSLSIVKQLDDLSKTHGITKFCWDPSQIS